MDVHFPFFICDENEINGMYMYVWLRKYSKLVNTIALRLIISYQIVDDFCRCTSQT
jgi:hypothetical protein